MAKRRRIIIGASTVDKRLKEGRGQGKSGKYKPWLYIHDVPSRGRAWRIKGWKTGRPHHLLSDFEHDYLLIKDWDPSVIDIREQYPLLPLEETLAIAEECNIRHPSVRRPTKQGGVIPVVMTTDFVLTISEGLNTYEQARTLKLAKDLESERTLEKLEIERRYWMRRNIDWAIVTEHEVSHILARNIQKLHKRLKIEDRVALPDATIQEAAAMMTSEVLQSTCSLSHIALECDKRLRLRPGTCLTIAYYLMATRQWKVDMYTPIQPGNRLILLNDSH
jgi:TnsA-like endonuclease N terminal/TnsA endonuclease C terminal